MSKVDEQQRRVSLQRFSAFRPIWREKRDDTSLQTQQEAVEEAVETRQRGNAAQRYSAASARPPAPRGRGCEVNKGGGHLPGKVASRQKNDATGKFTSI